MTWEGGQEEADPELVVFHKLNIRRKQTNLMKSTPLPSSSHQTNPEALESAQVPALISKADGHVGLANSIQGPL